ncbi:radical SAM protein [Candidatus Oscillochloris fontis]|uniref:radical SAM protein n=1 Tax=Candidatus Oscillochloris fontis TaxID=2496868 RepID=UPI00101B86F2|nr:radical SAM protein [Candidatus Oscillochloris fontis]
MANPSLYDMNLSDLEALLRAWGQPAFRTRQIYRQLYLNLAADPAAMTDLPQALRERLAHESTLNPLHLVRSQVSADGLTRKALFALPDGVQIETVLMIYADRATVCVSTQAGCAMGCSFCATATLDLRRNLTAGEMVAQVLWASREVRNLASQPASTTNPGRSSAEDATWWGESHALRRPLERVSNLVFMGMGEPFANYDRWWEAVQRLHDPLGFNMGARSMTVSTVGLVPGILRLADAGLPINLAISLHAPDDALRNELVPINTRYPIKEILAAAHTYVEKTGRRVSFEYVLIQGRNDHPHQALALAKLLRHESLICHVNLIPWNPLPGSPLARSDLQRVRAFQQVLVDYGLACTVRVERGVEIAAACGQLAGGGNCSHLG